MDGRVIAIDAQPATPAKQLKEKPILDGIPGIRSREDFRALMSMTFRNHGEARTTLTQIGVPDDAVLYLQQHRQLIEKCPDDETVKRLHGGAQAVVYGLCKWTREAVTHFYRPIRPTSGMEDNPS